MTKAKVLQQNEWKAIRAENYEAVIELKHSLNSRLQELRQPLKDELASTYLHKWVIYSLALNNLRSIVKEVKSEIMRISLIGDEDFLYEFGHHLADYDEYEYALKCGYNECDDYWDAK